MKKLLCWIKLQQIFPGLFLREQWYLQQIIELKDYFHNNCQLPSKRSVFASRHVLQSTPDIFGGFCCRLFAFLRMSVNLLEFHSKPRNPIFIQIDREFKTKKKVKSHTFVEDFFRYLPCICNLFSIHSFLKYNFRLC